MNQNINYLFIYWADVPAESHKLPCHRQCVAVAYKLKNDTTCNLYLPILIDSCFVFCQTELGEQIQEVINQGPCNFVVDFAA